jgi:hypothetical protein
METRAVCRTWHPAKARGKTRLAGSPGGSFVPQCLRDIPAQQTLYNADGPAGSFSCDIENRGITVAPERHMKRTSSLQENRFLRGALLYVLSNPLSVLGQVLPLLQWHAKTCCHHVVVHLSTSLQTAPSEKVTVGPGRVHCGRPRLYPSAGSAFVN